MRFERWPTFAVVGKKPLVLRAELEGAFGDAMHKGRVSADVRLDIEAGDSAAEEKAAQVARYAEVHKARFAHRVDDNHLAPATAKVRQAGHQARMIARRVCADEKYQVGLVEVFQLKCAHGTTKDAGEPNAAGRM